METPCYYQNSIVRKFSNYIKKINLFDEDEDLILINQLLATTGCLSSQLSRRYSSILTRLCSQTFILQGSSISFDTYFHPVCSSQFINQSFTISLSDKKTIESCLYDFIRVVRKIHRFGRICMANEPRVTTEINK
ncbi:unnamed protein product [Adineta ricciae]|uniref:Uncharacterized protein n=1 Tax=Adineta ricciae TaxID=249248 RepID=A0A815QT18_ADIRI|nr:unnamed protein product [Adineta ricciae]